jgi:hypothetical protein
MERQTAAAPWGYYQGVGDMYMLTNEGFQAIRREVNCSLEMGDGVGFMCTDTVRPSDTAKVDEDHEHVEDGYYQHLKLDTRSNEIRLLSLECVENYEEITGPSEMSPSRLLRHPSLVIHMGRSG